MKIWDGVHQNIGIDAFAVAFKAVVGPLQQMLVVQHWIDQEILRNKYPAHCNHSFFIYVFQFDFECTT